MTTTPSPKPGLVQRLDERLVDLAADLRAESDQLYTQAEQETGKPREVLEAEPPKSLRARILVRVLNRLTDWMNAHTDHRNGDFGETRARNLAAHAARRAARQ